MFVVRATPSGTEFVLLETDHTQSESILLYQFRVFVLIGILLLAPPRLPGLPAPTSQRRYARRDARHDASDEDNSAASHRSALKKGKEGACSHVADASLDARGDSS